MTLKDANTKGSTVKGLWELSVLLGKFFYVSNIVTKLKVKQ